MIAAFFRVLGSYIRAWWHARDIDEEWSIWHEYVSDDDDDVDLTD